MRGRPSLAAASQAPLTARYEAILNRRTADFSRPSWYSNTMQPADPRRRDFLKRIAAAPAVSAAAENVSLLGVSPIPGKILCLCHLS
jgi:hypothetical protein